MTEPVRWGIMSTANINAKVLKGAALTADVNVVAVGSRDGDRSRAYASQWGIERAYGSYEELLADDDVEAVYIPLPNSMHHDWTMRSLEAGKHVLCEKPYSRRAAEVCVVFDRAEQQNLVLSEAFMFRYHPHIRALVQLVTSGQLGRLRLISGAFSGHTDNPNDVRLDAALDGGSLMDVGVYPLSASRLLAGEPISVTAQQVTGPSGVDVSFAATMRFNDDVLAHFDCAFHVADRSYLEVVGTEGRVEVSDPWHGTQPALTVTMRGAEPVRTDIEPANPYQLELEEFGKAVRGEPNQLIGRADAEGQAKAVEALYRAADAETTVRIG
ncbi:MAG TPA: Gfo/Idh/MocA family oxidoreductase [Acidothermaceae bacterium]|nr:Gfo/Idh/MocA family oxidoreductase [Acidothermaceae bacterium]